MEKSQFWGELVDNGVLTLAHDEVSVLERQVTASLLNAGEEGLLDTTPYLWKPLSNLILPKDFFGTITTVEVSLGESPLAELQVATKNVPRNILTIEQLKLKANCSYGNCLNAGAIALRAWYFRDARGKFNQPVNFPLKRRVETPEWVEESLYLELKKQLMKRPGLGLAAGRSRQWIRKR